MSLRRAFRSPALARLESATSSSRFSSLPWLKRPKYPARSPGASSSWPWSRATASPRLVASPPSRGETGSFARWMLTCSISSRLLPVGTSGGKENLRVYREDETHPAAGLPCTRYLERPLDGGGGDPH